MGVSANDGYTVLYTEDGRSAQFPDYMVMAQLSVGWYTEMMAKVYASGGRSKIVPLDEVSQYQAVGWYPLVEYIYRATFSEMKKHFGTFEYVRHYPGTPESDDVPLDIYRSKNNSTEIYFESIGIYDGKVVDASFKLKHAFPYLALYADANGKLSIETFEQVFDYNGLYGKNYRSAVDFDTFSVEEWLQYSYCYVIYGGGYSMSINTCEPGYININDSFLMYLPL